MPNNSITLDEKSQAMLDFLQTCPAIQNNPLFFNFGNIENNSAQVITRSDDVSLQKPYIDGSVLKRYTFSIDTFKSVAYNPVVSSATDENLEDFTQAQEILNWIIAQNRVSNFPDFPSTCTIEEMKPLTTKPELVGVDTSKNPHMAIYRISVQIDYIDTSECIWC